MNAFTWKTGERSIFCTDSALRYAKAVMTGTLNQAKRPPRPMVEPRIHVEKPKPAPRGKGRPLAYIDEANLRRLRAKGWSISRCAKELGFDPKTVSQRLLLMAGRA